MTVVVLARAKTTDWLRELAGPHVQLAQCSEPSVHMQRLVLEADLAVLELRDDSEALTRVIGQIRSARPTLNIAIYCTLDAAAARAIVALARAGANQVLLRGYDDVGRWFQKRYDEWRHHIDPARVLDRLPLKVPLAIAPFFAYCLAHAHEAPSVSEIARALGIHRRTLVKRLANEGTLAPRQIVSWCRVIVALDRLERSEGSVEQVAHVMRFGSAAALHKMCVRYAGRPLSQLRGDGGVEIAINAFLEAIGQTTLAATQCGGRSLMPATEPAHVSGTSLVVPSASMDAPAIECA